MVPTEHQEQCALIQWADKAILPQTRDRVGDYLFAIPNGGQRHKKIAAELKAEGVRAGVCDLMLAYPIRDKPGLFVEMKRVKGSSTSEDQKKWIARLKSVGYVVEVCKGWTAARTVIENYILGLEESA